MGGPQAGIICGQAAAIERIALHPLARAVRADKTCLAGVAATLRHYARGEAATAIPVWRMIGATADAIQARAEAAQATLARREIDVSVAATHASVGGGSLPGQTLPSWSLVLGGPADELARRLRLGQPRVFGRIERGQLLLDLRTILPEDDGRLVEALGLLSL
jgi:L-seryl-tRNA(Ser) seleniumtransferase